MEKTIKLVMENNKEIEILVNGVTKLRIDERRSIKADEIFSLLDFSMGDHYSVEKENPFKRDEAVLNFFSDVISDIIGRLNEFSIEDEDVKTLERQMEEIVPGD